MRRSITMDKSKSQAAQGRDRECVQEEHSMSSPPQEVLQQMDHAARVHDTLHAQGRELHFAHDDASGRMTIEVRDARGNVLRQLSPSEALQVAAGKPLE
jgi:uncharacterized FlaG/YvyC family protein